MALGFKIPKVPKAKPVASNWKGQITQQNRRVSGVTPKGLRQFTEQPARWIPRASGLLKHLATGKISKKGLKV